MKHNLKIRVSKDASYGTQRSGSGTICVAAATESEIKAGSNQYKPIVPNTLSYAVQSVGGDLTVLQTDDKDSYVAAINEMLRAVNELKTAVGFAYLGDYITSIDAEIYKIQNSGHSEYLYYKFRFIGCTLTDGTYVSNSNGEFTQNGKGQTTLSDFVIGFNPQAPIATPITNTTLDSCIYYGEENSEYKTVAISDITDWSSELTSDMGYAVYMKAQVTINNS